MNRKIKSHNAAAFPSQALSHVAQQIDALYWAAAEPDARDLELHPDAVRVGADLRDEGYVLIFPVVCVLRAIDFVLRGKGENECVITVPAMIHNVLFLYRTTGHIVQLETI